MTSAIGGGMITRNLGREVDLFLMEMIHGVAKTLEDDLGCQVETHLLINEAQRRPQPTVGEVHPISPA